MKTINKILFFIFFSMMFYNEKIIVNSLEIQSKTQVHSQNKIQSKVVLDIMKSLLSSKPKASMKKPNNASQRKNSLKAAPKVTKRKQDATIGRPKAVEVVSKTQVLTEFEKLKVELENWLQI